MMNKCSRVVKRITSFLAITVMCVSIGCVSAFADVTQSQVSAYLSSVATVGEESDTNGNTVTTVELPSSVQSKIDENPVKSGATGNVVINVTAKNSSGKTATKSFTLSKEAYSAISSDVTTSNNAKDVQNSVNTMSNSFNIKADISGASTALSGFKGLVQLISGFIAYAIVILFGLSWTVDVMYMAFPVFRNKAEEARESGNKFMTREDKSTGETKLRFVSDEAVFAIQQASVDSGKSPWGIYMKKKIYAMIAIAIILYLVITGNLAIIVEVAIKFVQGIIQMISSLAS